MQRASAAAPPALGSAACESCGACGGKDGGGVMKAEGGDGGAGRGGGATVAGFAIEGVSIAGQETCIIFPALRLAFDIGRCPQRAVFQELLLLSHAHMDHLGGVPFHVASRGLLKLPSPRVVVPPTNAAAVARLLEVQRELDGSELECTLVPLSPPPGGEEGGGAPPEGGGRGCTEILAHNGHFVRAFRTYHTVPSQGYVVYSRKKKLRAELVGRPNEEIKAMKLAGEEVTDSVEVPEVAFTGDTTADFLLDPANSDALRAKLLVMEMTFVDDSVTVEHARKFGHMHIRELAEHADRIQSEHILLIHFSARYKRVDILEALERELPPAVRARCTPFLAGFA